MASQRKRKGAAERPSIPGGWRTIGALGMTLLGTLAPVAAVTGRTVVARREEAARSPRRLVLPLLGGLAAAVAAGLAWRARDTISSVAREAAAGIVGTVDRLAGDGSASTVTSDLEDALNDPGEDWANGIDGIRETRPAGGEHVAA